MPVFIEATTAGGGGGGANYLWQATTLLDNDQIKAIPTTGVEVAPAPGANLVSLVSLGSVALDTSAGAYTLDDDVSWQFIYGVAGQDASTLALVHYPLTTPGRYVLNIPAPVFVAPQDVFTGYTAGKLWDFTAIANQPILIQDFYSGVSNYTGGNALNTARVSVQYYVLNTATGLLVPVS